MENRLTPKQIKPHRETLMRLQGNLCPLCRTPFEEDDIIHLDHDHRSGHVRASLHGACNLALGKVERAARMTKNPQNFVKHVFDYIDHHQMHPSGLYHPSHLTKEEKAAKAKRRAVVRRKKVKSS